MTSYASSLLTLGDENCYASRNTSGPRQLARPQGMLRLRDPKRIRCKERTRAVSLLQSRQQLLGIHSRSSLLTLLFPPSAVRMLPSGPRGRSRPRADLSLQRPLPNACEGYAGFNEVVGEMFHHHPSRSCVRRPRAISFSSLLQSSICVLAEVTGKVDPCIECMLRVHALGPGSTRNSLHPCHRRTAKPDLASLPVEAAELQPPRRRLITTHTPHISRPYHLPLAILSLGASRECERPTL
jgi:hypothetical protein